MGHMSRGQELTLGDGLGLGTTLTLGDGGLTLESEATPIFSSIMTNTISPAISTGDSSPTFTRATTATVTDFEGSVKTVNSGEARFQGARRVENLCANSENFASGLWSVTNGSKVSTSEPDPLGGNNAVHLSLLAALWEFQQANVSVIGRNVFSFYLKSADTNSYGFRIKVNGAAAPGQYTATPEWQRFTFTYDVAAIASLGRCGILRNSTSDAAELVMFGAQNELVDGQANEATSEYVSTDELSAPYHGAGVDGVQYFSTENGNTVTDNVVTEATGPTISSSILKGYLSEGARTNLISYSGDLSNALWVKGAVGAGTAPVQVSGNTYTYITGGTTGGSQSYIVQDNYATVVIGDTLTASFVAYADASVTMNVSPDDSVAGVNINLTTTPQAFTVTTTANVTLPDLKFKLAGNVSGNVTRNITIENIQLEKNVSFASSYIPTVATAVTRNADQLSYVTAGNFSDTAGTAYAEVEATDWTYAAGQILGDGTEAPLIADSQKAGDLPGSSGDYFSTPDSVAASITGDIDLIARVDQPDWAAANARAVISKFSGGQAYQLNLYSATRLNLLWRDAVGIKSKSSVSAPIVSGINWIRATLDVDNGAGGYTVNFYTSADSTTDPDAVVWVQVGVALTTAGVTSILDDSGALQVGAAAGGTGSLFTGTIYRAQVYNGIDGTLAVDFNANDADAGDSSWASSTTGETWTANGNAAITSTDAALVKAYDGTNTAIGPTDTTNGIESIASTWNGGLIAYDNAVAGDTQSYDGSFGLTQLNVGQGGWYGTVRNLKLWDKPITQAQLEEL